MEVTLGIHVVYKLKSFCHYKSDLEHGLNTKSSMTSVTGRSGPPQYHIKREVNGNAYFWLEWLAPRMPLIAGFLGFIFELLK